MAGPSSAASALEALHAVAPERQAEKDLRSERQCRITLAKDAARPLTLPWCRGKLHDFDTSSRTKQILEPGKSMITTIGKAEAYFGPFTVLFDMKTERDERVRSEMGRRFQDGRAYALMNWGDYPRDKHGAEIGPHRFPHVVVEPIEPDGEPWSHGSVDLHELYQIGKHDSKQFVDQAAVLEQQADETDMLHRQVAEMRGILLAHGLIGDGARVPVAK